jgi:multiple antibiotic resistance protein
MDKLLEFGLLAFASLFTLVNPLGVIPVFTTMTAEMSPEDAKSVAYRAVIVALSTMILFALSGKFIFDFFNISINGLRIVGGILFFMAGYDMLQARLIRTKSEGQSIKEFGHDIAITPLGIPLICGPGAITASIVLMNDAVLVSQKIFLFIAMILVMSVTLFFLLGARKVMNFLGENGNKVLMRIMGLIVMVIAVEFMFSGLKPIVRDILNIQ